jgi:hypothetical protein
VKNFVIAEIVSIYVSLTDEASQLHYAEAEEHGMTWSGHHSYNKTLKTDVLIVKGLFSL